MTKINSSCKVTSTAPLTSLQWMVALCHTVTRALPFRRLTRFPQPLRYIPLQGPKSNRTGILKEQALKHERLISEPLIFNESRRQCHRASSFIKQNIRHAIKKGALEDESAPCVGKIPGARMQTISSATRLSLVRTRGFASPDYSGFARSENVFSFVILCLSYAPKNNNFFLG
jgi:hypothetical protein